MTLTGTHTLEDRDPAQSLNMNRDVRPSEITILDPTETTNSFLYTRTVGTFTATIFLSTAIQKCNAFTPHFQGYLI